MAKSRAVGRYGWNDPAVCTADDLRLFLANHIAKGDPVDVGNFAMMLFNRNETTAQRLPEPPADVARDAERWQMLPAFLAEFQVPYLQLVDKIDAAIEREILGGRE